MDGGSTPIPPFAEEALAVIKDRTDESQEFGEQSALKILEAEGFTTADAKEALEVLEMRGYLYRVDDELRITG
ncbi:hypothetical protein [Haloarchaeobius iranensis]|uniref:Uncharacterized protein n=1 Tax=Haloarchaeobius iranensis TaxID=996166 RepID=A0A1H0A4C4_9EURY|nr:hypothetical protein [Haloarchaeobius iranensis]SDN28071.1 hypothetical protein SAMN05192554_12436 [Haloarchaeobius iranensis]